MPRTARLDAPGVLHHVMIRGIERRKIFRNNIDREDFIERLEVLCYQGFKREPKTGRKRGPAERMCRGIHSGLNCGLTGSG